VARFSAPV